MEVCWIWPDYETAIEALLVHKVLLAVDFLLLLTFDLWPRFNNPNLGATIQEVAKFNTFLKCFFLFLKEL